MTSVAVAAASGPAKTRTGVEARAGAETGGVGVGVPDNRLYIGDCLPVLAELGAAHGEFADLVYLDPPFNSARLYNHAFVGRRRTMPQKVAFADTWRWTEATAQDYAEFTGREYPGTAAAEFLSAMRGLLEQRDPATLAYLTYMTRRLARIRAVMKPSASVYLHCDPTASHYLKLAMDAVFGRERFRNEIVWWYKGNSEPKKQFPRKHDILLYYAGAGAPFHRVAVPYSPGTLRRYNHVDEQGRRYKISALRDGKREVVYMKDGKAADDVWEMPVVRSKERLGYATQKPVALLRRILEASSRPGDLALDPFCGCGTTIAACHELGRRFIGVDVARSAAQVITRRMAMQYPEFGRLVIGDQAPKNARGWGRILPEEDDEAPAWLRFQYEVIAMIPKAEQIEGKLQRTARRGADGGVDGLVHLERPKTRARASVVIQAKRKKTPSVADVNDTLAAVDNNGAFMGLLITLHPPTAEMVRRGKAELRQFNGKFYPKVAILTYDEVKAGKFREAIPYAHAVDPEGGRQTGLEWSTADDGE